MQKSDEFNFEISLSVLNHLGRHLYRSFATVLGEAISNSWDADAKNVWISVDQDGGTFSIKDDGVGMDAGDFQNKFLRIGYTAIRWNISPPPEPGQPRGHADEAWSLAFSTDGSMVASGMLETRWPAPAVIGRSACGTRQPTNAFT